MKNGKMNILRRLHFWSAIPLVTVLALTTAITTMAQPSQSSPGGAGDHPMMMQGGMMQTNSMMSGRMQGNMMQGNMMARCYEMATMDRMMQARTQDQHAELQRLVTQMKQAPKGKRTALMEGLHLFRKCASLLDVIGRSQNYSPGNSKQ